MQQTTESQPDSRVEECDISILSPDSSNELGKEQNSPQRHINDLPYSALLKIFSFLTLEDRVLDACLVCKFWHQICYDGIFWQDIDFEDRKHLSDDILLKTVSYSNNVTSLNVCDCYSKTLSREGIVKATKSCPNLKTLILKGAICDDITNEAMIEISENCPKLRHLEADAQALSDLAVVLGFAENLHELEHLNINQNRRVTDKGVIALIKSCPNLCELKMNQIPGITDATMEVLGERDKKRPRMKVLSISMCGVTGLGTRNLRWLTNLRFLDLTKSCGLCSKDLELILPQTSRLTHFFVAMLDTFDDRCVELAVIHLKELREVYFGSTPVTDTAMEYMAKHGKALERIDVPYSKVTHIGAKIACENVKRLRRLGMTRCDNADEAELELLVQRFPKIAFATFLQDAKRMLMRAGQWEEDDMGIVTQELIMEKLHASSPRPRLKPRRLIASGGKIEYIPY